MKKHMKKIALASFALLSLLTVVGVYAADDTQPAYWYYFEVPARQGWVYTTDERGDGVIQSSQSSQGNVLVEASEIDVVTFYAGGYVNDKYEYPSAGTIMQFSTNDYAALNYKNTYKKGTKMRTRARNHTWALLKTGVIHGYLFYY